MISPTVLVSGDRPNFIYLSTAFPATRKGTYKYTATREGRVASNYKKIGEKKKLQTQPITTARTASPVSLTV